MGLNCFSKSHRVQLCFWAAAAAALANAHRSSAEVPGCRYVMVVSILDGMQNLMKRERLSFLEAGFFRYNGASRDAMNVELKDD